MYAKLIIREVGLKTLLAYANEELTHGGTTLSAKVSAKIQLSLGKIFLITPEGLDVVGVQNWPWDPGHLSSREANSILSRTIHRYLSRSGNRVLIQDFEATRSDPSFEDDPLRIFYGEELYWELQSPAISEDKIGDCVNDASYWPWIGYFAKARISEGRDIEIEDLEEAASQLVGVAIQALHDSYLVWWRTDLEPFPDPDL